MWLTWACINRINATDCRIDLIKQEEEEEKSRIACINRIVQAAAMVVVVVLYVLTMRVKDSCEESSYIKGHGRSFSFSLLSQDTKKKESLPCCLLSFDMPVVARLEYIDRLLVRDYCVFVCISSENIHNLQFEFDDQIYPFEENNWFSPNKCIDEIGYPSYW